MGSGCIESRADYNKRHAKTQCLCVGKALGTSAANGARLEKRKAFVILLQVPPQRVSMGNYGSSIRTKSWIDRSLDSLHKFFSCPCSLASSLSFPSISFLACRFFAHLPPLHPQCRSPKPSTQTPRSSSSLTSMARSRSKTVTVPHSAPQLIANPLTQPTTS